jgi:predicted RecB family nuclease
MQKTTNSLTYSASDLILFMRSPFASWMTRLELEHPEQLVGIEKNQDAMMALLAERGNKHESEYLASIKDKFGAENVIEIAVDKDPVEATKQAIRQGYKVIYQACLERENFKGYVDFLVKQENQSEHYYEVWDTKLSKSAKPYFIIQLCCYSWMLEPMQAIMPEYAVVVLGNQKEECFRLPAYISYFLNLKQQFLDFQNKFQSDWSAMPDPALYSDHGDWAKFAQHTLAQSDSLALVANIRKSQIKKLRDAGIDTLSQLAKTTQPNIKGLSIEAYSRLREQADIQLASRGHDKPQFNVIKSDHGKGLSALPPKSASDVYFDIEGHPLMEGGLEYLWGVSFENSDVPQGKQYAFKDWWAHDQNQEKQAFEGFIDWVYDRWQIDPGMHIYHYASYEITAINKLANRYQTRKDQVIQLLASGVFIDLYKLVKNGLLVGEPKYSIKNIEHLYRGKRTTEVASGGDSVVFYEHWREDGGVEDWTQQAKGYQSWLADTDHFDWSLWPTLKEIRDYNIDDCESTLELVAWLREQQLKHQISFRGGETIPAKDIQKTEKQLENEQKRQALIQRQQALIDQFENDVGLKNDPQAQLLTSLLHFYDRERKPKIFSYYQRLEKDDSELFDDDTVIHDLTIQSSQVSDDKIRCTALFNNDQPVRKDKIASAIIKNTSTKASKIEISELDDHSHQVSFTINQDQGNALDQIPLTLFGEEARINTDTLEKRLCDITEAYFKTRQLPKILETIFNQANPRLLADKTVLPITRQLYPDNTNYLSAIIGAVKNMDETCLCIQGPPGAGKTYTAKNIIKALVKAGKRIGVMSNSHAAIMNLLSPLQTELPETAICKVGGYGSQQDFESVFSPVDSTNFDYRQSMKFTNKKPYGYYKVTGATVYGFANDIAYETPLDYLFVDEASQVALANLVAVSGSAKNIILMGDQMQLEQPIQGSHPGDSGASALEFMLKGHAVIPEDKGIFLERTYRMHPAVCKPLSEIVYEGKLQADAANVNQAITIPQAELITQANGILSIQVQHEGKTQSSLEEVLVVQQLINELKTGIFTNKDGQQHSITDEDILVIAPYNMQVNLLMEKLTGNIKIGTIDKFQGQEAPVVIISMAISDVEDSPRGLDFVFDINRLNVAVSRAQALAIVVANEGLAHCNVNRLEQMAKVGLFYKLTE